ncbi:ovostatin-like isoform X1 [Apostichopus japonicus]|uniref:ovostatin-like isoform X1 n=1 Tax=Stichopus japonicus TaxID=307972 RepID=UPI003AB6477C
MECLLPRFFYSVFAALVFLNGEVLAESGYVIIASQHMSTDSNETVCIDLVELQAEVTLQLLDALRTHFPPLAEVRTNGRVRGKTCLDLQVPPMKAFTRLNLRALVEGTTDAGESFSETKEASIQMTLPVIETHIQTDKPIYKAAQTVRIRVLSLTYPSMKPYTEPYNEIYITSPDNIRVRQWRNVVTMEGMVDLAMQLSGEPVLGNWTIHVILDGRRTTQTFEIDEYVLPKFDVLITPPSYIFALDETVEFSVCGLYTYGQPVRGSIAVNASLERTGIPQALSVEDTGDDGCHTFDFPLRNLGSVNSIQSRYLILDVEFTELVTGIARTETHGSTEITKIPLTLDTVGRNGFKPGLPYRFQILAKLPNSRPASFVSLTVTAMKTKGMGDFSFEETYTTDQDGRVNAEFRAPFDPYITELKLEVTYRHPDSQILPVRSSKYIDAWYSPSGSFLAIRPLTSVYPVDENLDVEVEFTIPESDADTILEFSYIVSANRNLVTSGTQTWSSGMSGRTSVISRHVALDGRGDPTESRQYLQRLTTDPPNLEPFPDAILGSVSIPVPVTQKMAPSATILLYFTRQDGEVVSARQEFKVKLAFENDVSLDFNSGQVYPGSDVLLNIRASPLSLCAIGSVDKSILLLADSNRITSEQVFSPMSMFAVEEHGLNESCPVTARDMSKRSVPSFGRFPSLQLPRFPPRFPPRLPPPPRTSTRTWSKSLHFDSLEAFQSSGVQILSNLFIETRPCYVYTETRTSTPTYYMRYTPHSKHFPTAMGNPGLRGVPGPGGLPDFNVVNRADIIPEVPKSGPIYQLRTHFPDTWLWHLSTIGKEGVSTVSHTVPHSITDWVTTGFCTSAEHGIGIAEPISLRVFQPFFISTVLPYSVIQDEEFPLKITVFNYLSECFTVVVRLEPSSYFSIQDQDFFKYLCVCGGQAGSVEFSIIPRVLGKIPIIALGEYIPPSQDLPECGKTGNSIDELLDVWDAVNRTVLVEAEGTEVERAINFLICPDDAEGGSFLEEVSLEFPFNTVPGTGSCKVQVTGNVLGPVLTNLGSLVRMPTGCGEQNMIGFTPNIFVLMYLVHTNQRVNFPEVYNQAKEYMQIGYERELQYRLNDGSYSAFGQRDGEGSTWLTAFVLKSFAMASEFIDIDSRDMEVTRDWLVNNALDDDTGCFIPRGRVIHKSMQGGHSSGVTLTAYTTIALIEAGEPATSTVMFRAVYCLFRALDDGIDDTYTLALVTYALAKVNINPIYRSGLTKLQEIAVTGDGTLHWTRDDAPPCEGAADSCKADPAEIEMTSYVLLIYLEASQDDPQFLLDARLIVEWLNEQRNSHGGFTSTQDTVIGLEALASYAERVHSDDKSVIVDISTTEGDLQHEHCEVTNENDLVMEEFDIRQCPNTLRVFGEGEGCVLFQAVMQYNLPVLRIVSQYFDVQVEARDHTPQQDCSRVYLDITVSYLDAQNEFTNMAVVDVKMVSGYSVDTNELERYIDYLYSTGQDIGLMRYDHFEEGKPFSLYFNQFSRGYSTSFVLVLKRDIHVKNTRPAFIKVYDYYEGGVVTYKSYHPCSQD